MQDAIILYENGKAIGGEGHPTNASDITFDNTGTDLVSENVEDAIKEVNTSFSQYVTNHANYVELYASGGYSGEFSLSEPITNFRALIVYGCMTGSPDYLFSGVFVPIGSIKYVISTESIYLSFQFSNTTTVTVLDHTNGTRISGVYGIR